MIEVAAAELARDELDFAAGVLSRAYCDTPLSRAVYGDDPIRRLRGVERAMARRMAIMDPPSLVACRDGVIVGVCGIATPGACELSLSRRAREAPELDLGRSSSLMRILQMAAEWDRHHPEEGHWHLGPVGVEPTLQGMGVGNRMVERFCDLVDTEGGMAYLETDDPRNVCFFERFGFVTVEEAEVLGVRNWFMRREPKTVPSG